VVVLVLTQAQVLSARPLTLSPVPSVQDAADGLADMSALLRETLPQFQIDPDDMPAFFQQQVRKRLYDYAESSRPSLQSMLQRAAPYLPSIRLTLKQQNVPTYFAYVPLVESAFQTYAGRSEKGPRGLWQLLPDTARAYGLRVSQQVDDRLDPLRATRAASHYLRELQETFGFDAPLLVLAAYNCGEHGLARAIARGRTRDIWSLMRQGHIPYRTRDFLVKMVALWVALAHTERFQLTLDVPPHPKTFGDAVMRPAALRTQAQLEALSEGEAPEMAPQTLPAQTPAPEG
jgi:membrane-bound lytic murein transglycosylase D